ncbi:DNA (cytosine-5-)-methyltransferase [Aureisphaera galaxeae]|uniref:DNA cytosine methyltransferase n=1 Tax=Aureisphaera galaxeae TaxID=1538023 RepID=UPI00234FED1B|nr:DNA (cytosine-5-)-methyltransferase [Aureisphaera galaxeae]MDC8005543.1 DNA (cytosine-5-)-methyltransferase [Aureisphaera galaxeae]
MATEITHIDCFSGPGGICTGFKAAGISTKIAIEKVESCVDTYSFNHPEVEIIHKDIRQVTKEDIKSKYADKIDVLTSGMPCETFSTAGATSRSSYDFRQQLYSEAIRIAKIVDAKIILFENVPGILSKKVEKGGDRLIIEDLLDELSTNGYKYYIQTTLKANDFLVPQKRERYFIIATNEEGLELSIPIAKHNGITTVKDAFQGLPKILANDKVEKHRYNGGENIYTKLLKNNNFWKLGEGTNTKLTYHVAPKHREPTIKRFELLEPGENLRDLFFKYPEEYIKELQQKKILPKKWYIQRNKRLKFNEVSKTVTSHCLDELVHPKLNRALTVREVARLQSFPDNYQFVGGPFICPHMYETQDKYEQIGDAVPPLLAYHWGLVIKKLLN